MVPPPSLGNNYLDSIDNNNGRGNNGDDNNDDGYDYDGDDDDNSSSSFGFRNNDGRLRGDNNRWGSLFGQPSSSAKSTTNRAGINGGGGMGGMRTAIRPSPPNNSPGGMISNNNINNNNASPPSNNYGIGRRMQKNGEVDGIPRIVSINRPQDLLDFVVQDERLSVGEFAIDSPSNCLHFTSLTLFILFLLVKVYASWCKTCQVFDTRYRKLASQLGDTINSNTNDLTSTGSVRFAEMRFDDPNNEEMCRLLNATKLPYILMYRGSRGKVADFQCGPAKFQLLIDAVNEHVDDAVEVGAEGGVGSNSGTNVGGEQEWRVVREQQQVRNQQLRRAQQAAQYGGSGSIANYPPSSSTSSTYSSSSNSNSNSFDGDMLKRKEDEVTRLYTELSNLRKGFDQSIVRLKEEHKQETTVLNERIRVLTKEYDDGRRALSAQIKDLSREMMDREKAIRSSENAINQGLRNEMKTKEEEYAATLSGLSSRISELERDLLQSNNELQYKSNADTNERQQLLNHIATLEQRITDLEKELIEEKRIVVASTEEASRVLRQLEKIKNSEDRERNLLSARVEELEADIARREEQMMNYSANGGGGVVGNSAVDNMQRQMDELRKARDEEIDLLRTRIADLEEELDWQSRTASMDENSTSQQLQKQQQELLKESKQLTSRILELENEIDERDKLLRTSNKATDILLDNMEAQKRDYERELERTASLVNELEEAIVLREEEMRILQERYDALERMAEELQRREAQRDMAAGSAFTNAVQIAEMRSKQQQQPFTFDALFGGSTGQKRNSGWKGSSDEDSIENYELLKDVLMPDDVSPRGEQAMPRSGAGRSDNIWENVGAGLSSLMSSSSSGAGRVDDTRAGAGSASFGSNTPSPAAVNIPAGIPTPAMAFERRLAENPIVPAGAFGGSKPTASFFSRSKSSESIPVPSDTPDYYQNVISNFNNNAPSLSPRAAYEQRPTAPAPRVSAPAGTTENIYAGAGSASTYPSPAVVRQNEPIAPVPTPAMAFERRLAESPIVPSGAFGGAKPTAHFFSQKPAPASSGAGVGGPTPPEDDPQSKWRKLDESEKKRVAAEAYKAFEKSLEDSRRNTQIKPKSDSMSRASGGITGGGGGGSDRANKRPVSADAKNQSQMELERKKHQGMVKAASTPANNDRSQSAPPLPKMVPKTSVPPKQNQSARQIQESAVQASAKRMVRTCS